MKTINPLKLEALIESGEPVELIDVRVPGAFRQVHALGARSVPLQEFEPTHFLHTRALPHDEPLYIMSYTDRLARLAAEELAMADFDNAVVVEGGLAEWDVDGLPMMRHGFLSSKAAVKLGVGLLICAGLVLSVVVNDIDLFVALVFISGVLLWRLMRQQNRVEIFPLHTAQQHRHA